MIYFDLYNLMNTLGWSRGIYLEEKANVTTGQNTNMLKIFGKKTQRKDAGFND